MFAKGAYGKGKWDAAWDGGYGKGPAWGDPWSAGDAWGPPGWADGAWPKGAPDYSWDSPGKGEWEKGGGWPKGGWEKGGCWDKGGPAAGKGGWDSGFDAGKGKAKGKDVGKTTGKSAGKGSSAKEQAGDPQANGHSAPASLRIVAEGLPSSATEESVGFYFGQFGEVTDVSLTAGRAIVTFGNEDGARMALECYEGGAVFFEETEIFCTAFSEESSQAAGGKGGGSKGSKGKGGTGGMKRPLQSEDTRNTNDHTIYVGNLPSSADEEAVASYFGNFGQVLEVRLNYDDSGKFLGFGYVTFGDKDAAEAVLGYYSDDDYSPLDFDGTGNFIQCNKAAPGQADRGTAKSGGPAKSPAQAAPQAAAPAAGANEWSQKRARYGRGPDDGSFVQVSANLADSWTGGWAGGDDGWGDPWAGGASAWGAKEAEWQPDCYLEEDKIWIGGLPKTTTEEEISEHYSQFGAVKEIMLKKDRETGELRGFGFITFDSAEATQKALAGATLGDVKPSYGKIKWKGKGKGKGKQGGEAGISGATLALQNREKAVGPTDVYLRVSDMPPEKKNRDVFKLFYNYSIARLRESEDETLVQFTSKSESEKAFNEKQGAKMGTFRITVSGATKEDFERAGNPYAHLLGTQAPVVKTATQELNERMNSRSESGGKSSRDW